MKFINLKWYQIFKNRAVRYEICDLPKGWSLEQNAVGDYRAYRDVDRACGSHWFDTESHNTVDTAVRCAIKCQATIDTANAQDNWKKVS